MGPPARIEDGESEDPVPHSRKALPANKTAVASIKKEREVSSLVSIHIFKVDLTSPRLSSLGSGRGTAASPLPPLP